MTAEEVFELALTLIDQSDGLDTEDYAQRAPALIDILQRELAFYEDVTVTRGITTLDDTLQISDDTAERIMPYGLAASFALADKNGDMYADYSAMYRSMIRTIRPGETDTTDMYGATRGMY